MGRGKMRKRFRRGNCGECMAPLSHRCRKGAFTIRQVKGDRKLCARMADLGLYPGTTAELVCGERGQKCIVKVNGGTLCLDPDLIESILVSDI